VSRQSLTPEKPLAEGSATGSEGSKVLAEGSATISEDFYRRYMEETDYFLILIH
jgi:hypothetical protein